MTANPYQDESPDVRYERLCQLADATPPPRTSFAKRILALVCMALVIGFILLPVLYSISTSLKPRSDIALGTFWPVNPTLDNWLSAFDIFPLASFIRNSVIAAGCSALVTLALTGPATYAMVRLGAGRKFLPDFTIATYIAPPIVALLPLFIMLQKLSLTDSLLGMTIVYSLMNIPVAFWLLRGFVAELPKSIDEAAWLDGAGYWRTFFSINLPLLLPGLIATGLICAILSFNEFLFASAMTFSPDSRTLPVGISLFQGERFVNFGQMAAASLAGMIPVYFIAIIVQKWLIGGLAHGSVK